MRSFVLLRGLERVAGVLLNLLDRFEEILIATLMAAATLLIFVAVVHRYGTGVPFLYPYLHPIHLSWAQELCIYMFVWMAKFPFAGRSSCSACSAARCSPPSSAPWARNS